MAIDTQNKRRSVQAYTLGLMRPVADGTIGMADRATVTWYYSGLSYDPNPPASQYETRLFIANVNRFMSRG